MRASSRTCENLPSQMWLVVCLDNRGATDQCHPSTLLPSLSVYTQGYKSPSRKDCLTVFYGYMSYLCDRVRSASSPLQDLTTLVDVFVLQTTLVCICRLHHQETSSNKAKSLMILKQNQNVYFLLVKNCSVRFSTIENMLCTCVRCVFPRCRGHVWAVMRYTTNPT